MKLTIKRAAFLKILTTAFEAIPVKSPEPAFVNFLLTVSTDNVEVLSSDGDLTIKGRIPLSSESVINSEPGSIQIPAKYLLDIMRKIEGETVTIVLIDSSLLNVADERSDFNLNIVAGEEYPDIDMTVEGDDEFTLSSTDFSKLVDSTSFAVATRGVNKNYYGVNIAAYGDELFFLATDSARLARKSIAIDRHYDERRAITVPVKALQLAQHCGTESTIRIKFDQFKALFYVDDCVISTRLYKDEMPNIDRLLTVPTPYLLNVDAQSFINAIERVTIVSAEKQFIIRLVCECDRVEVSARSASVGTSREVLTDVQYDGPRFEINFNVNYVREAIKALGDERVTIAFAGENKAFFVRNGDPTNVQLITPIRSLN